MSANSPAPAAPSPAPKPPANPLGPPDEAFWDKYNGRSEFPISTVATVLLHVAAATLLIVVITRLMNHGPDRGGVPITLVEPPSGGEDDSGAGSAGSGGIPDPIARADASPLEATFQALPDPKALPQVVEEIQKEVLKDDPTATVPVSPQVAAGIAMLDKKLREKMLGLGGPRGDGPGDGRGDSGQAGKGPGGNGADSTRARSLRWVLRFRTNSGRDYLDQLAAMGAIVIVPVPPNEERCLLFSDLRNPGKGKTATDADLKGFSTQLRFSDIRPASVKGVSDALALDFTPRSFWAFFPKSVEDELSRKETAYRNRRAEDIEETVFTVTVRGGSYELLVYDQIPKR